MLIKEFKGKLEDKEVEVVIELDPNPQNPRESQWNMAKLFCWHSGYELGDKHNFSTPGEFSKWLETAKSEIGDCVVVPLYLYDHSGITMSTEPFSCKWDSGLVGWAVIFKHQFTHQDEWKQKARYIIKSEVNQYDHYLTGNIYMTTVYERIICKECSHSTLELLGGVGNLIDVEECYEWLREFGVEWEEE